MSYVVLARKWRPMTFSDLVGQDHVSQTLGNAIAQNRVAHAFLFTGVRGVGKTTSARILAKALNCLASAGPTATPCLACSACKEITDGVDMDVQEIDGASYNGVDEVRKLQESLPYRPNRDRYKIIIVDEVHMLSQSAWNAFLKTLEEPPPHVKFIFATTEVHKVPVTILSRVQRFDFKLIPARLIMDRLRYVLTQEKIGAEDAALSILSRQAAGSMRDAMSLLDQVIAWSNQELTEEAVARVLGVASRKLLLELGRALIDGQAERALRLVDDAAQQGFDMVHVARDLLALLRDVVVGAVCTEPAELLDLPAEEQAEVIALKSHGADDLLRLHQGFSKGYDDVARGAQPRAAFEMLLVRLARRPPLLPLDDLIDRLSRLEQRVVRGGAGSAGSAAPGGGQPRSGAARPTPQSATPALTQPVQIHAAQTHAEPTQAVQTHAEPTQAVQTHAEPMQAVQTDNAAPSPAVVSVPARVPSSAVVPAAVAVPAAVPPPVAAPAAVPPPAVTVSAAALAPVTVSAAAPVAAPAAVAAPTEISQVERWRHVVNDIRSSDPKLGAFLDHAEVIHIDASKIELRLDKSSVFHAEVTSPATVQRIAAAAEVVLGGRPSIHFDAALDSSARFPTESVFAKDKAARTQKEREDTERAQTHPAVIEAIRVLGARVKGIELPKTD